jgi:DNA-binding MurR/RpiR family transcriptional regulator
MKKVSSRNGARDHRLSFAERINRLSKKRRELIRPVQEQPRDYVLLSIRDAAHKLGTDASTVLRITRGLGFPSYREFKPYLEELSIASATSLESKQDHMAGSSIIAHGHQALEQDIRNIHGAIRSTPDWRLARGGTNRPFRQC